MVKPAVVAHTCNPSTQETEAGGWQVQTQPRQFSKACLKIKNERLGCGLLIEHTEFNSQHWSFLKKKKEKERKIVKLYLYGTNMDLGGAFY